jgi:hypothetical protein
MNRKKSTELCLSFEPANHAGNIQDKELLEDYDNGDYELDNEDDILLDADDEEGEKKDNQGICHTGRVRTPPQS